MQPHFDQIRDADKSLDAKFPEIAAEWHPTSNGDLTADAIPAWSDQIAYWYCRKCKNEWTSRVDARTLEDLCCPTCKDRDEKLSLPRLTAHEKSLAVQNKKLAQEWHPTKNGELTPRDISAASNKKVWWLCPTCGHEWNTGVRNRNGGRRCPICSKQRLVKGKNDLLTKFPEIAAEWHPTKNNDLTPRCIHAGSGKNVWWLGKCGHEWEAIVAKRTVHKYGCPFESGNRLLVGFNDLATRFPEIAAEWHPAKNGDITPDQILSGSGKTVWWLGKCGHEWESVVKSRTGKNAGCPFEVKPRIRLLAGFNDLATTFPEIAAEWHPTKNGDLTPNRISASKHQKVWWLGTCGHEWEAVVAKRTASKTGCPFDSGRRLLSGFNDLATKFPKIAAEWHPAKNGDITPDQILSGSGKTVWWLGKCGHEWDTAIAHRTVNHTGCPFEAKNHARVLTGFNDLVTTSPDIAAEWHPTKNGNIIPDQVSANSNKKVWWLGKCGHEWEANIAGRTRHKYGCPFDSGRRLLAGFNDFATKFPNIAAEWHPTKNGDLTPDKISASNHKKVWWLGECGHEWEATIVSRTGSKQGCPFDSGKRTLAGFNDLATKFPNIAAEWHPTKNGDLTPDQITAGNRNKVWWLGVCGHEWYAGVYSRTGNQTGCPFDSGKRILSGFNDLATTFPDIAAEWHPTKNGYLMPDEISASSKENVWWLGKCGHQWHRTAVHRTTKKTGCPFKSCRGTTVG